MSDDLQARGTALHTALVDVINRQPPDKHRDAICLVALSTTIVSVLMEANHDVRLAAAKKVGEQIMDRVRGGRS